MRNKRVTLAAGFALLLIVPLFAVVPSSARALTAQEIQQQVTALLAQIARLQEQLKSMQAVQSTPVTIGNAQKGCPTLSRSLSFGAQGSDVLSLQQFLVAQNLLAAGASNGYFDATTERAVQQLQIRYGVVVSGSPTTTGYGAVGPRTRSLIALNCNIATPTTGSCPLAQPPATSCSAGWQANTDSAGCVTSYKCSVPLSPVTPTGGSCTAIALQCPSGTYDQVGPNCSHTCVPNTQSSGSFTVSPASGSAPLSVSAVFPTQWQSLISQECGTTQARYGGRTFIINWGDGTYPNQNGRNSPCAAHTYSSVGTYQVSARIYDFSDVNEYNGSFTRDVWTGNATVTVGGSVSSGTLSVSPSSGATPLAVTFAGRVSSAGSYTLDFGDGTSPLALSLMEGRCVDGTTFGACGLSLDAARHTYASAGTYTARLLGTCYGDSFACSALPNGGRPVIGTVTVTVGGGSTSSGTLSASPSSGNAPLAVNFSGSVNSAGYSIDFGDGTTSGDIGCAHGGCPATSVVSAVNVGHTYTAAGTYTAKLRQHFSIVAGNCAGVDCNVVGTVTITVSGGLVSSCPVYSAPLCNSNQHLVGGAYNSSTGCYGAPQCVAN